MVTNADAYEIRVWYTPDKGDEGFLAVVAEMPGVSAWGRTREEAFREIQVALKLVLSTCETDNEAPPPPLYGRANSVNYPWEQEEESEQPVPAAKRRMPSLREVAVHKPKAVKKTLSLAPRKKAPEAPSIRARSEERDRVAA